MEQSVMKVAFADDGTGTREQTLAIRMQSQAGVQALGVLTFAYLSSNENVEFDYIRVRKPDGPVVNTPAYNVQDMPAEVTRAAPMYSDIHEKHVTVKGLGVGDVLEYRIRYRTFKPQIPGQFWWEYSFDKNLIYRDSELQLTVPKDKYLKLLSPDYKPQVKDEGANRTYLWKTSNLKRRDPDEPVSREQKPDVQLSTFHSWQEVGAWYNDLQKSQLTVTPQIQAKVAELTKGLTSDDDKGRAIYNYVATRFHYVSLSFGVGRYQPHPAEDVLENEYGDCKDKHTLLATMLKAAGIEAWPALINAERKLDLDMPSPGQFNHVITYVPRSGNPLWLDTTPEVAPFGLLLAGLRDKRALVIPSDKPAELKTTPANPPFPVDQTFTIEGAIDKDGTLEAHVKQTVRGDYEVVFRMAFRNTAPAQWKDLMQRVSSSEGFGGDVSNATASPPEDTTKPFEISYDYTRKSYSDWENHRMIAPLPPTGLEGAAVQEKKPVDPVVLGAMGEVVYTSKIDLPDSVHQLQLQPSVSLKEPYADYDSSYSMSDDKWTVTRRLKIKQNEVPLASWDNYKKFSKAMSDDWGSWTQLSAAAGTDKNAEVKAADTAISKDNSSEDVPRKWDEAGDKKWDEAGEAMHRNDLTTAEEILRDLLKEYGDQRGLHGGLGEVYAQRNDRDRALTEFAKEEQLHPDNIGVYRIVATYYLWLHRDDSAAEQYRKWIQLDSKNYDAYAGLAAVLYRQKKYSEVLQLWLGALQQLPDNKHVKKSLAYAYLSNKQFDKGVPLLEQGLDADSTPLEYNSASYRLADANIDLAKAKEWGDKALDGLYHESLDTTIEDVALSNTTNIGATWDTVGWVYYKMGDFAKAEAYLHSAFALSQDPVEGDHLAQAYQKQGKKEQAEHTYRLACAQAKQPLKDEIKERYQQLMGKDADPEDSPVHLKRGSTSRDFGPEDELSRIRTVKISTTEVTSGSATFTIAFTPGKIGDVKFVSGEEKLKPMATQIASSKLRADFPDATPARLTRRGVLMCGSSGCDFTLLLPSAPYTTESQP